MAWLIPLQQLTANTPGLAAVVIVCLLGGIIIGWLLAYLPGRGRTKSLQAQNARLETAVTNNKLDGEEARAQIELLRGELRTANASQAELRNQLVLAEEAKTQVSRTLEERETAIENLMREQALAQDTYTQADSRNQATTAALSAELEAVRASLRHSASDNERLAGELSQTQVQLASTRQALRDRPEEMEALRTAAAQATQAAAGKQTALDEAYSRAAALLQILEEREARVAALEAQLSGLQSELDAAQARRSALEGHLLSVRGDVAGEMVRVTQALIKVKEEQLGEANERCAALLMELTALKAREN